MRIWGQPEPGEVESGQDSSMLNKENNIDDKGKKKFCYYFFLIHFDLAYHTFLFAYKTYIIF